jgi:hypothetical protein
VRLGCGYDPRGAEDGWLVHKANLRRPASEADKPARPTGASRAARVRTEDVGDIAVIEDNGDIIIPPRGFDLKNKSIVFTPEADGYRAAPGEVRFEKNLQFHLSYFFGNDGTPGDLDDGYRELELIGAQFPFFGTYYDRIFVGTNGYVTFTAGDTGDRPSVSALTTELPRIAPLWADLNFTNSGAVYYDRFQGRHVFTWNDSPQAQFSGASTFQLVLYDDGRIAFVYKKVKARSSLIGISPGSSENEAHLIDLSDPPANVIAGPFYESFSKQKRLDLPALARAFYLTHADVFDTIYLWTDFDFDNGPGVAHAFNVRNNIKGLGMNIFDRGAVYGSPARLASILTMGNIVDDWPSDPQANTAGLNSAIAIVCHEQGHRWLAYVRFDAEHDIKDDLLGRDLGHWSFLTDTRTTESGNFSSLMEGNSWREDGSNSFTTIETAVNYFSKLDLYLMGLLPASEVGPITYLQADPDIKAIVRSKSPISGFSMNALRKTTSVDKIVEREGARTPDERSAPKQLRIAFVLLVERGAAPRASTLDKTDRYRESLVRYFSTATSRRAALDSSLADAN